MSKQTLSVFKAWKNGLTLGFDHLRTTGDKIVAFKTPILERAKCGVIFNIAPSRGKHARIIAQRQREIAELLRGSGMTFRNAVSGL